MAIRAIHIVDGYNIYTCTLYTERWQHWNLAGRPYRRKVPKQGLWSRWGASVSKQVVYYWRLQAGSFPDHLPLARQTRYGRPHSSKPGRHE